MFVFSVKSSKLKIALTAFAAVLAAAAMSVVVCLVSGRFSGNLARFAIGTLSGIVVYALCTVLLRSETVGVVLRRRK